MSKISIWVKLFILLFSIGAFSVGITVYWGFHNAKSSLKNEALAHLVSIRDIKKHQIENYFLEKLLDTEVLANAPALRIHLEEGARFASSANDSKAGIKKTHDAFQEQFYEETESTREKMGFYDIFLIDKEGNILHTLKEEDDLGTNLIGGKYKDSSLAKVFAEGLTESSMSDVEFYEPSEQKDQLVFCNAC